MNLRSHDPQPCALPTKLHPDRNETNLRFFSSRGQKGVTFCPAALFPSSGSLNFSLNQDYLTDVGYNICMWQENENKLQKQFQFGSFDEAIDFVNKVAKLARSKNHHPTIINTYDKVSLELSTHEAGGTVTEKDTEFAKAVDAILSPPPANLNVTAPDSLAPHIKLFGDGGSRGNPGPSASGYVILDPDDNILFQKGVYLGITTNNQAEYQSLRMGLEEAHKLGAQEVAVHMDSLLVINQMKGIFKVKNRDLWPIHESIKELATRFKKVTYTHVPRELNKLADAQVNIALDAEAGK